MMAFCTRALQLLNAFSPRYPAIGSLTFASSGRSINYADFPSCSSRFGIEVEFTTDKNILPSLKPCNGTPYYLNLHSGDVPHGWITGATGSGKSFFMSFLLQSAQKYQPLPSSRLGASYEM